ncbi:hypothetical protein KAR91_35225 [Candidatus Pacearchaeota archaeon]|nr:hypothetical protein [Candidatus Pacearchaeota archaeon]
MVQPNYQPTTRTDQLVGAEKTLATALATAMTIVQDEFFDQYGEQLTEAQALKEIKLFVNKRHHY